MIALIAVLTFAGLFLIVYGLGLPWVERKEYQWLTDSLRKAGVPRSMTEGDGR